MNAAEVKARADDARRADRAALSAFVDTVEATGGVETHRNGLRSPAADVEWLDLGEAYVIACEALGRVPLIDGAPACGSCRMNPPGSFAPSHDGSPRCESGSIASGGRSAHCACDTCF